jgi:hypothetical protein
MIEAIGAKQQEASALRAQAPQGGARPGDAADPSGPAAAVAAMESGPYFSPVVRLDAETQRTVILFRDVSTGKVQIQYPSERQLEAYRASLRQRNGQGEAGQADDGGAAAGDVVIHGRRAADAADGGPMARFSAVTAPAGDRTGPAMRGLAAAAGGRPHVSAVTA